MPPRKSNVSTISNPEEGVDATPGGKGSKDGVSVEDLSLPKSMIARLAKGVLPPNTQIHKDALLALHKSATVFVSFIASNSNENAQSNGKKTISPQDVLAALKDAELEEFLPRLEAELKKYNEIQCDKRNTYRKKVKDDKAVPAPKDGSAPPTNGEGAAATPDASNGAINGATNGHAEGDDAERPAKKLKQADGGAVPAETIELDDDDVGADQDVDEPEDDEEAEDDVVESEDEVIDEDDANDETMGDAVDEVGGRSGLHDEALDEPDSD